MKPSDIIVIDGHTRIEGESDRLVKNMLSETNFEVIYLKNQNISYYDYDSNNIDDDFIPTIEKISAAKIVIFVTPVYWYTMSAVMKVFFDRFSDLITIQKELGRSLKGKKCYVISCGSATDCPESFEEPFKLTCKYFNMDYKDSFYYSTRGDEQISDCIREEAMIFVETINQEITGE